MPQFELKLAAGKPVVWEGTDGENAARRYVDMHREAEVVAWRTWPRWGIFVGVDPSRIIG